MISLNKYTVSVGSTILEALKKLEELSLESVMAMFVVDGDRVRGSVTAGDVRRALIKGETLESPVERVMNPDFTYLTQGGGTVEKLKYIKRTQLKLVPVLDEEFRLIRVLNFQTRKSYLPVDAVLMAGGKGERLRPLTLTTPKPLLEVAGTPIIDYNIENMHANGIEHIYVTTNYLAEQIEEHFSAPRPDTEIRCIREPQFLGTMGSVKLVPSWHKDYILVMNSDLFTNIDIEDFFFHFREHDADMSLAAVPYSVDVPYGIFEIENARDVKGIKEKPTYHYYANAGIYLLKKEVLDLIPDGTFFNATDLIDLLIRRRKHVIRYPLSGYWIDIGKPEDFKKVQDLAYHLKKK